MEKKVLFVVTSHDKKGDTGQPTGYYLGEVSHPWDVLHAAGYEIDFVSPKGGKAPVDGLNLDDAVNRKFWEDEKYHHKIEHTLTPSEVKPEEYAAISTPADTEPCGIFPKMKPWQQLGGRSTKTAVWSVPFVTGHRHW
ncbi:hypothetical protein [Siphonobacter sp. SORGH_AS_0500]|uniref:hypothetical protein n=1 Tax=Siphonobacter sp. SORGH_AS_0500 TaxID=1864824 RepID=UPI0018E3263A|nr:hypothetical protein [Siphonobacter sp. SORGH_AS_0500]